MVAQCSKKLWMTHRGVTNIFVQLCMEWHVYRELAKGCWQVSWPVSHCPCVGSRPPPTWCTASGCFLLSSTGGQYPNKLYEPFKTILFKRNCIHVHDKLLAPFELGRHWLFRVPTPALLLWQLRRFLDDAGHMGNETFLQSQARIGGKRAQGAAQLPKHLNLWVQSMVRILG